MQHLTVRVRAEAEAVRSLTLVQHRQPLTISLTEMRASWATVRSTPASPYSFLSHAHLSQH